LTNVFVVPNLKTWLWVCLSGVNLVNFQVTAWKNCFPGGPGKFFSSEGSETGASESEVPDPDVFFSRSRSS